MKKACCLEVFSRFLTVGTFAKLCLFIFVYICRYFLLSRDLLLNYFALTSCRDKPVFPSFIIESLNPKYYLCFVKFNILMWVVQWIFDIFKILHNFVEMSLGEVPLSVLICLQIFN